MFATLQEQKICFGDFVDYLMKNELTKSIIIFHFLLGLFMHCVSYVCLVNEFLSESLCITKYANCSITESQLHRWDQQSGPSKSCLFTKLHIFNPGIQSHPSHQHQQSGLSGSILFTKCIFFIHIY